MSSFQSPAQPLAIRNAGRRIGLVDRLITPFDQAVRTISGAYTAGRPYPAEGIQETLTDPEEKRRAAALMRVNHSGEVAAQALYQGQSFAATGEHIRGSLEEAAREETDHLAWCASRIHELGGRTSLLNPFWYCGSFAIGALAGAAGDRASLGFVAETERQVVEHLEGHLHRLPVGDARSRAIVTQMSADEERHGGNAMSAGGVELPRFVRALMRATARVMTGAAYWL